LQGLKPSACQSPHTEGISAAIAEQRAAVTEIGKTLGIKPPNTNESFDRRGGR
jgi:hypothetical protein